MNLKFTTITALLLSLVTNEAHSEPDKTPGVIKRRYVHACPAGTERVGDKPPKSKIIFCRQKLESGSRLEGPYTSFYGTGNKKVEGEYTSGKKNGTWINYHRNGELSEKREFVDGKVVEKISYRPDGSIIKPNKSDPAKQNKNNEYEEFAQAARYSAKTHSRTANRDLGWSANKTKRRRSIH